jgi:hypothetical protein
MSEENAGREWIEQVPEFARGWGEIEKAENMEALFNNFGEMRSHLGKSIKIPSDDASAEAMQEFHKKLIDKVPSLMPTPDMDNEEAVQAILTKLGRPEGLDGYAAPEGDSIAFEEAQLNDLKAVAHELGLTKKQFTKFAEKFGNQNAASAATMKEQNQSNLNRIQTEWGLSAEAKYQEVTNFAKQAGAPEQLVQGLIDKKVDADTVFWLSQMSKNMGEKTNVDFNSNNSNNGVMTPSEAEEKIAEIYRNREHPYHSGDEKAQKRMHELMRLSNPKRYA